MPESPRKYPQPIQPLTSLPSESAHAPPLRNQTRAVSVVAAGMLTTAITLAGVYFAKEKSHENIMGWYAYHIVPAGAILVGMAASSGYAIASWFASVKIRRGLLGVILGLMLLSYFAAEYVEFGGAKYIQNGIIDQGGRKIPSYRRIGFWEYFDLKAVNWTWEIKDSHDTQADPPGTAGYAFVLLGIVGFCFSGLIIPMAVSAKPYCDSCERFMKTQTLVCFPAIKSDSKVPKKDQAAQSQKDAENQLMVDQASARLVELQDHVQEEDVEGFERDIAQTPAERKAANNLFHRLEVKLVSCPSCATGRLESAWLTDHGNDLIRTPLPPLNLSPDLVLAVTSAGRQEA